MTAPAAGTWSLGSDLPLVRVGLGALRLVARGPNGPAVPASDAVEVLRAAVDLGVNHLDTAAFYRFGEQSANDLIRTALSPYADDLVIATKVGPRRHDDGRWEVDVAPAELVADVERNLRELGRDQLDLVYLRLGGMHGPIEAPVGNRFATLAGLQKSGLVRHLGLSNATPAQLAEGQRIAPVVAVQNHFNLAARDDATMLRTCVDQAIAYVPFPPVGGNQQLTGAALQRVAERHGVSGAQIALAWLLDLDPAVLAIPGTASVAHLRDNVAAAGIRLTATDRAELVPLPVPNGRAS